MGLGFSIGFGFNNKSSLLNAEALEFIDTVSITDSNKQSALSQLVIDLKNNNLWYKLDVIYPFIGDNATKNSYNLKNTNQYQISWNGSITHDANGVTGDGGTGYGNTGYKVVSPQTDIHISAYIRNNIISSSSQQPFGAYKTGTTDSLIGIRLVNSPGTSTSFVGGTPFSFLETQTNNFFNISRDGSSLTTYKNNSNLGTVTTTDRDDNLLDIFILGSNFNGSSLLEPGAFNMAFFTAGKSLNTAENEALYNCIQTFQTSLGRQN